MRTGSEQLDGKYRHLQDLLKQMKRVLVAYSGGVDSTLLLKVAKDTLGDDVLAVTAESDTSARHERDDAARMAEALEAEHIIVATDEMDLTDFVENTPDRCYVCKRKRFGDLTELAREEGFLFVIDGENADDIADYRPGSRASRELGVRSPLREANFSKDEVRRLSKGLRLPTWDRPAYACLASRIPYGQPITTEKLRQIDGAEEFVRDLIDAPMVRVRHHGDIARIELSPESVPKLLDRKARLNIVEKLKQLGFSYVTLDLEGYVMGSLNRDINTEG
ncbi:ATP-dependent sacrificial sulfur transferase LarE [Thermodesulfobacteriota bacterium]